MLDFQLVFLGFFMTSSAVMSMALLSLTESRRLMVEERRPSGLVVRKLQKNQVSVRVMTFYALSYAS